MGVAGGELGGGVASIGRVYRIGLLTNGRIEVVMRMEVFVIGIPALAGMSRRNNLRQGWKVSLFVGSKGVTTAEEAKDLGRALGRLRVGHLDGLFRDGRDMCHGLVFVRTTDFDLHGGDRRVVDARVRVERRESGVGCSDVWDRKSVGEECILRSFKVGGG